MLCLRKKDIFFVWKIHERNNLNPTHQANVYAESGQILTVQLYDKDDAKEDERLGMYV